MRLTNRQELFCIEISKGNTQKDAYIKAGYSTKNMKDETIRNNAYMLMQKSDIAARIKELKDPLQKKFEYTMEQSFEMFKKIQEMALNKEDLSNFIKAEELKGKLLGLYTDKVKTDISGNLGLKQDIIIKFED